MIIPWITHKNELQVERLRTIKKSKKKLAKKIENSVTIVYSKNALQFEGM